MKKTATGFLLTCALAGNSSLEQVNLNMDVLISASCSIANLTDATWSGIDGNFAAATTSSSGKVTVSCNLLTSYSVGLGNGQNFSSGSRRMKKGSEFIAYNVYKDLTMLLPWGNIGSGNEATGVGTGLNQALTVYAKIPAGQTPVSSGTYTDVVVVTLNF